MTRARIESRALDAMRNVFAEGWTTEALLVDHAAHVIAASAGGMDKATKIAQAVYDRHYRVTTPN
jgi:hypothetical protein